MKLLIAALLVVALPVIAALSTFGYLLLKQGKLAEACMEFVLASVALAVVLVGISYMRKDKRE